MLKFKPNTKIYPLEVVLSTAYLFVDRAYVFLQTKGDNIEVSLKGKKKISLKQLEAIKGEFYNELLNCALRLKIAKRNKDIRQYIVQQALFSATSDSIDSVDLPSELDADYKDDPLGIAIPWEEQEKK